jgi:magnesium chelatase family protein
MTRAILSFDLSARAATRVQKVARTLADLADSEAVDECHLAEALMFRAPPATTV